MRRVGIIGLVAVGVLLAWAVPSRAQVVINEVLYDATGTDSGHEWVELYNNGTAVDLKNWKLQWAGTSFSYGTYTIADDVIIPASGYFLIGGTYVEADTGKRPDIVCSFSPELANAGSYTCGVRLANPDASYTDTLLYGTPNTNNLPDDDSPAEPTNFATKVTAAHSLERNATHTDTNNCAVDFHNQNPPTPDNSGVNYPPTVKSTWHIPATVTAADTVTLKAWLHDDGGIATAVAYWRVGNSGSFSTTNLTLSAGTVKDGTFTAVAPIPAQPSLTMVQYYIVATDGGAPPLSATDPSTAPAIPYGYVVDSPITGVAINELLPDPPVGVDINRDGVVSGNSADEEFVELYNHHSNPVEISGWVIGDPTMRYTFPKGIVLAPSQLVTVFGKLAGPSTLPGQLLAAGNLHLINTGNTVYLKTASGATVDMVTYTSTVGNANRSYGRRPDGSGGFVLTDGTTVATPNTLNYPAESGVSKALWELLE